MKKADIQAHYAADIKRASDWQLFAIVRREIDAPHAVREALFDSAVEELQSRGYPFPVFTAAFSSR